MFLSLLLMTFFISIVVCNICVLIFSKPLKMILQRLINEDIYTAWLRYIKFAIYIVGISAGVRINSIEQYINPSHYLEHSKVIPLTYSRLFLEVYRTVIGALAGIAWLLLVFFIFALVAYVITKAFELRGVKIASKQISPVSTQK